MTTSSLVRWGILSTARINAELLPGFAVSATSELLAVASRSEEKALAYATAHSIPRSFGSYEALLLDPDVECVYISLPNGLHGEWVRRALGAGKNVLCEKPLTPSASEAAALFGLAESRRLVLAEAVMYRHHVQTRRLLELIDAGAIGELRHLHASFHFQVGDPSTDIRYAPDLAGGALRDVGIYCISLGNILAGQVPTSAVGSACITTEGVDARFFGTIAYPSGFVVQFDCSMDTGMRVGAVILGASGWLSIPNPWYLDVTGPWLPSRPPMFIEVHRGVDVDVIHTAGRNAYLEEIDDFARAVRGERGFLVPPEETVLNLETLERLADSARQVAA
jgi:predicted dehydrogenase